MLANSWFTHLGSFSSPQLETSADVVSCLCGRGLSKLWGKWLALHQRGNRNANTQQNKSRTGDARLVI